MKLKILVGAVIVVAVAASVYMSISKKGQSNLESDGKEKDNDIDEGAEETVSTQDKEDLVDINETKSRVYSNMTERNEMAKEILDESFSEIKRAQDSIDENKKSISNILDDLKK